MADKKISALTAETALADADLVPGVDASTSSTKSSTWTLIKAFLKTYFDTLYVGSGVTTLNSLTSATALPWTGMKAGTDGEVPTFNAAGAPSFVPVGTVNHVLTSNGAGAAPTFKAPTAAAAVWG